MTEIVASTQARCWVHIRPGMAGVEEPQKPALHPLPVHSSVSYPADRKRGKTNESEGQAQLTQNVEWRRTDDT